MTHIQVGVSDAEHTYPLVGLALLVLGPVRKTHSLLKSEHLYSWKEELGIG